MEGLRLREEDRDTEWGRVGVLGRTWLHVLGAEVPLPPSNEALPYLTKLGSSP